MGPGNYGGGPQGSGSMGPGPQGSGSSSPGGATTDSSGSSSATPPGSSSSDMMPGGSSAPPGYAPAGMTPGGSSAGPGYPPAGMTPSGSSAGPGYPPAGMTPGGTSAPPGYGPGGMMPGGSSAPPGYAPAGMTPGGTSAPRLRTRRDDAGRSADQRHGGGRQPLRCFRLSGAGNTPGQQAAKPLTLADKADLAFRQGRDKDAIQYLYAHAVTADAATAKDVLSKMGWIGPLKRPSLAMRWGIAIEYVPPRSYNGSAYPIGTSQNLPVKGAPGGKQPGGPQPGGFGAPGMPSGGMGEGGMGGSPRQLAVAAADGRVGPEGRPAASGTDRAWRLWAGFHGARQGSCTGRCRRVSRCRRDDARCPWSQRTRNGQRHGRRRNGPRLPGAGRRWFRQPVKPRAAGRRTWLRWRPESCCWA